MNPRTEKRRHGRYAWAELGDRLILTLVLAGIALFILYPVSYTHLIVDTF